VSAGYSGKTLSVKLGLKSGQRLLVVGGPSHVDSLIADAPTGIARLARLAEFDVAWVFATRADDLASQLSRLLPKMADGAMIWASWPKKASGVTTDVTEDRVRDAALPLGLVDVKVCAVDETWSGLKLLRRRSSPASPRSPATRTRGARDSR
jgi:hypothetical protein